MGTSLNRSIVLNLKNKSGQSVNKGDVVILDSSEAASFSATGSAGLSTDSIGVVINPTQIVNDGNGLICIAGYIPQINLISGANLGDTFSLSSTAKYGIPHATIQTGDFGQVLEAGTTPQAILWGDINQFSNDGWISANETWTYLSGTMFTISGVDLTEIYVAGLKLRCYQSGDKYFYVRSSSFSGGNTTIAIQGGNDYSLTNAAINNPAYSRLEQPQGFPEYFTWTPNFIGSTSAGTIVYDAQVGFFRRLGSLVFVQGDIDVSALTVAPTGSLQIGELPFNVKNVSRIYGSLTIAYLNDFDFPAGALWMTGIVNPNTTRIAMYTTPDNAANATFSASGLKATSRMIFSGWYIGS